MSKLSSFQPFQPPALQVHRRRQVRRGRSQNHPLDALGVRGGVLKGEDGPEAVPDQRDALDAPRLTQPFEVVDQQFEVGRQILGHGLVPIIEPEVDIHSPEKASTEKLLKYTLVAHLDRLAEGQEVMRRLVAAAGHNLPQEAPRDFASAVLSLVHGTFEP